MKTAVDQLIEKMSLGDVCKYISELAEAKEMEKERIKKANEDGFYEGQSMAHTGRCQFQSSEQYYNKTFKQEEQ